MLIKDVLIDQLAAAEYNPRTLTQDAGERLQRSLDDFSWLEPIVVNQRADGQLVIIGGHQRVEAARALGQQTVPCHIVESFSLDKEKAANRVLNNRKLQGEDDLPVLQEVLMSISDEFRHMSGDLDEEIEKLQDGWVDHDQSLAQAEGDKEPDGGAVPREPRSLTCPSCGHAWTS